jgi:uncharacterized protein (TIGR02217 family)
MDDFIETPRFDEDIAFGSSGGPRFKTPVFASEGPTEAREQNFTYSRGRWQLDKMTRDTTDMDTIRSFFFNARGKARGFRFKDWADFSMTAENIGTGDGVTTVFKITKKYGTGAYQYTRRIFKPVSATVQVYVNGVLKTLTTHYTLNATTGTITFTGGNTPPLGHAVTVTCEFDVPVRFDTDEMVVSADVYDTQNWKNIPIVEILIDE